MRRRILTVDQLEARRMLASDIEVASSLVQLSYDGDGVAYVVNAGVVGIESPETVIVSQSSHGLENSEWRRQTGLPENGVDLPLGEPYGLLMDGVAPFDSLGGRVAAAGDVNGDGYDDVVITAPAARDGRGLEEDAHGDIYVCFGGPEITALLPGSPGFVIRGFEPTGQLGYAVHGAGDVNGDGFDDIIVGSPAADALGARAGEAYVVFGSPDPFDDVLFLDELNGINGATFFGVNEDDAAGSSVSGVGDVNGDGIDDMLIGARNADPNGEFSGEAYIVFGNNSGFGRSLHLTSLNGNNGVVLKGTRPFEAVGVATSPGGDLNDDGIQDMLIGSYVVFGAREFPASLGLSELGGTRGFVVRPLPQMQGAGVGDVNGDKIDDVMIGPYIVFGSQDEFDAELLANELVAGIKGTVIRGDFEGGVTVDRAGDFNGDGLNDVVLGVQSGETKNAAGFQSGLAHVLFGKEDGLDTELIFSGLTSGHVQFNGATAGSLTGSSVAGVGDFNGDGMDDVLIGAPYAEVDGIPKGQAYLIYGLKTSASGSGNIEDHATLFPGAILSYSVSGMFVGDGRGGFETTVTAEVGAGADPDTIGDSVSLTFVDVLVHSGDVDVDGVIGFSDFLILSSNFGNSNPSVADGDLDADGIVGFSDFLILSANFGKTLV